MTKPRLQVYGQPWENMPAKIVGTREGLRALRQALEDVLSGEQAPDVRLAAYDGEPYALRVEMADEADPLHYTCRTTTGKQ